uniref:Ionotropic glutamate receptor C-terminal domain-containing protein n=1 Tax=Anopheles farauti TaxID=69004 RepID=A0A182Q2Z7_9DIPT
MSNEAKLFNWFAYYHGSCNFIPIDTLHGLNISYPIEDNVRTIYFIPHWLYEEISTDSNSPVALALRTGYQVVYDLRNHIDIYHWNSFSNRTITIDPHNISVPDELRDLHGYELVMGNLAFVRASMPFDDYLVELVASQRNATAGREEGFFGRSNIGLLVTIVNITEPFIVPGPGTTFTAIVVPRALPKPIISILVDPFDWYTWLAFALMLFATAISIACFGEVLGRHHFVKILLELIMITLAGPSRIYGGSFENRIITIFCLMAIVLASSYQSLAISFLSFTPFGPEINTLAEIEERCVFSHVDSAHLYNFKTSSTTQTCRLQTSRDSERQTLPVEAMVAKNLFKDPSVAFNYMQSRVENFRFARYRLNEYPVCYFISPRLREFFVFYVQAVIESGIYEYYYRHRSQSLWEYTRTTFTDRAVGLQDFVLLCSSKSCLNFAAAIGMAETINIPVCIFSVLSSPPALYTLAMPPAASRLPWETRSLPGRTGN